MKRSAFEFELAAARNCEQGYCRAAHKWASQNHRTNETQRDMVGVIAYYIRHCCDYKQWVINLHFAYGRRANQQPRAFRAFCRSPWWGYPTGLPKAALCARLIGGRKCINRRLTASSHGGILWDGLVFNDYPLTMGRRVKDPQEKRPSF